MKVESKNEKTMTIAKIPEDNGRMSHEDLRKLGKTFLVCSGVPKSQIKDEVLVRLNGHKAIVDIIGKVGDRTIVIECGDCKGDKLIELREKYGTENVIHLPYNVFGEFSVEVKEHKEQVRKLNKAIEQRKKKLEEECKELDLRSKVLSREREEFMDIANNILTPFRAYISLLCENQFFKENAIIFFKGSIFLLAKDYFNCENFLRIDRMNDRVRPTDLIITSEKPIKLESVDYLHTFMNRNYIDGALTWNSFWNLFKKPTEEERRKFREESP